MKISLLFTALFSLLLALYANCPLCAQAAVPPPDKLSPNQLKKDLALVKSVWENVHPGLYRYNTPAEIEGYFNELDRQTNRPMPLRQFFILLSQLNIKLRCGHSFVSYYNNKRSLKAKLCSTVFLPVLYRVVDGKFIVSHNLTEHPGIQPGDELTAIDGIPVQRIIDSLLTVSKADGLNGLNKQLDNITIYPRDLNPKGYCLFDIFFPLFFRENLEEPTFNLRIRPFGKGGAAEYRCKGLAKEERHSVFVQRYQEVPKNEASWYLKPVDASTAIFRLGDFATYNWKFDFNHYLDSIFTHLKMKGYENLIVDIRQNEGGADEARDAVLSYLTDKPIGCANAVRRCYRYRSIPDSLLPYLDTWDQGFKQPKPDSVYVLTPDRFYENKQPGSDCDEIWPKPNHFKGNIYLITDATNSSATFIMADAVKRNGLGKIVGEKTGGTQQGINGGELFFFYLPHSGIEMDVPLIYQAPFSEKPDDGILPDFEVKTTAEDLAKMGDPQLAFILKELVVRK
jgi:hypothetical protein